MQVIVSENFVQNPFVSVVIPSYNRANTVSQTIDSIINQQCDFSFEIIIGDDCSTDNARGVLLEYQVKYPEKIKLIFYDKNVGLAANWAVCIKECRGKYIANCDNDDYWHEKNKLQQQVNFLEQNVEVGLLSTNYRTIAPNGKIKQQIIHNVKYDESLFDVLMRWETPNFATCNSSIVYRAELLFKYVKLDDYIKYQFTLQDWNTWLFLSRHTKFDCLPINTTTVRLNNESITRPKSYEAILNRMNREKLLYRYMCEQTDFPYVEQDYDDYINKNLLNHAFKRMDYLKAKGFAIKMHKATRKTKATDNKLKFYIYCFLKKTRKLVHSL
jgi:glycosyltransferase involved in cell wall biosynthesis